MGLNYNFSQKPSTDEVTITYDPSIIKKTTKTEEQIKAEREEYNKEDVERIGGNSQSVMGFESSMGKEERMFKLRTLLDSKQVFTVTSASKALNVTNDTILSYAREMNISIYNDKTNKWTKIKE